MLVGSQALGLQIHDGNGAAIGIDDVDEAIVVEQGKMLMVGCYCYLRDSVATEQRETGEAGEFGECRIGDKEVAVGKDIQVVAEEGDLVVGADVAITVPIADRCHDGSGRQKAADEYD